MMPWWTAPQIEQVREGMARWQASARLEPIPTEDQCVNFGAPECTGRAEANGWCSGCWALIGLDVPRTARADLVAAAGIPAAYAAEDPSSPRCLPVQDDTTS